MEQPFDPQFRHSALIIKHLHGALTDNEATELNAWIAADEANRALFLELTTQASLQQDLAILDQFPVEEGIKRFRAELSAQRRPIVRLHAVRWWQYSAAAVLILFFSISLWQWRADTRQPELVAISELDKAALIKPGSDKAVLTLADGSTVEISDAASGLISRQQQVDLLASNGELRYTLQGKENSLQYNTLTTPKGGQYKLMLEDGTKVWLNAASSLRFPVAFVGNERRVILKGEGYFEVSPDAKKPFRVEIEKGSVEALGTAFNINNYTDEPDHKTTLLEGKVMVQSASQEVLLLPDQQAIIEEKGIIVKETGVDAGSEVAWKNGQFVFRSQTIEEIMKQLARWYDIEVRYAQKPSKDRFSGIVSRSGNLAEVLRILAEGGVKFRVEDRQIIVY